MTLENINKDDIFIFPEDEKSRFFEFLEKEFPQHIEKWLYGLYGYSYLLQGDIVKDLPIVWVDELEEIFYGLRNALLISNTCDMVPDRLNSILIAPIWEFKEYKALSGLNQRDYDNFVKEVKNHKKKSLFYLPSFRNLLKEGFTDLGYITTISSKLLNSKFIRDNNLRMVSLSQYGYYLLLIKINYFLCRIEGKDIVRHNQLDSNDNPPC